MLDMHPQSPRPPAPTSHPGWTPGPQRFNSNHHPIVREVSTVTYAGARMCHPPTQWLTRVKALTLTSDHNTGALITPSVILTVMRQLLSSRDRGSWFGALGLPVVVSTMSMTTLFTKLRCQSIFSRESGI